jgi:hypothetical protein
MLYIARKVWRYQRDNINPSIEGQTIHLPREKDKILNNDPWTLHRKLKIGEKNNYAKFEDTKGVSRTGKSKNRQQKKIYNTLHRNDWTTRTPLKIGNEPMWSGNANSLC